MPEKKTQERARRAKAASKSPSTQAGEFVREEIHHVREGKHGAQSAKQVIAIGLSKARKAGVDLRAPKAPTPPRRSRATKKALKKAGRAAASHQALAKQARAASAKRGAASRSAAARKAVRTKGPAARSRAAKKVAHTRSSQRARAS